MHSEHENNHHTEKYETLKKYYGYDNFREGQEELIDCVLNGRDVLGIMPTGAGKSICYQVPALMLEGITVVISPLISLMKDQVSSLNQAGVHAAYINSSLTENQINKAFDNAENGVYKIIYIAPERLDTSRFIHFVENADISLVAVDEAHCISQWGQDFRPGYLNIAPFIEKLCRRPVVCAFTATATKEVKEDIQCILGLKNPFTKVTGFDRKNLYFAVKHVKDKKTETLKYVKEHRGQCGIIYCATRNSVEEVCGMLCSAGIKAAQYHAGMRNEERAKNQEDFIYDMKSVMVATNAFGMGIDKSNVRYVLHYNMPQSMENYYQEAGRAGRDGENAECMLYYAPKDVVTNKFLIDNKESKKELTDEEAEAIRERDLKRLRDMTYYCTTKECLRKYILKYFGENVHGDCDNCSNCLTEYEQHDITEISKKIVNCVYELRQRFGINIVIGVLRGSRAARIKENHFDELNTYNTLGQYGESTIRQAIDALIMENILRQTEGEYPVLQLGSEYEKLKEPETKLFMKSEIIHTKTDKSDRGTAAGKIQPKRSELGREENQCFEKLRALRMEIAREEHVPPYIVFSDKTLIDMCVRRPKTLDEMLSVNGVGARKLERYGERFLEILR